MTVALSRTLQQLAGSLAPISQLSTLEGIVISNNAFSGDAAIFNKVAFPSLRVLVRSCAQWHAKWLF